MLFCACGSSDLPFKFSIGSDCLVSANSSELMHFLMASVMCLEIRAMHANLRRVLFPACRCLQEPHAETYQRSLLHPDATVSPPPQKVLILIWQECKRRCDFKGFSFRWRLKDSFKGPAAPGYLRSPRPALQGGAVRRRIGSKALKP